RPNSVPQADLREVLVVPLRSRGKPSGCLHEPVAGEIRYHPRSARVQDSARPRLPTPVKSATGTLFFQVLMHNLDEFLGRHGPGRVATRARIHHMFTDMVLNDLRNEP